MSRPADRLEVSVMFVFGAVDGVLPIDGEEIKRRLKQIIDGIPGPAAYWTQREAQYVDGQLTLEEHYQRRVDL